MPASPSSLQLPVQVRQQPIEFVVATGFDVESLPRLSNASFGPGQLCYGLRVPVPNHPGLRLQLRAPLVTGSGIGQNRQLAGGTADGTGVLEYMPTGCPVGSRTRAMAPIPSGRLKGNPGATVPPSSFDLLQLAWMSIT
jgi:hypothetical protein